MSRSSTSVWARRRARRTLLQALYGWQMTGADFDEAVGQFTRDQLKGADTDYLHECLRGVMDQVAALDLLFEPYLDRRIDELDYVERAILRAGSYEMKERLDVPARVVIDEWVELAKRFGAEDSFRYVNGVLDRVGRDLRSAELDEAPGTGEGGGSDLSRSPSG